jgi:hypothetical protein
MHQLLVHVWVGASPSQRLAGSYTDTGSCCIRPARLWEALALSQAKDVPMLYSSLTSSSLDTCQLTLHCSPATL